MLTCKDFLRWLNEYVDETADSETRGNLEAHVNNCPNCWVIFDTTKKTIQVYKGMEPQTLPDDVQSRLMAALDRRMQAGDTAPPKQ